MENFLTLTPFYSEIKEVVKMNIKFTHIKVKNFCGIKSLDTDLYDKTIIKGINKVGKSTIKNAIYWVLFNKLADGSSADNIRPHDADGKDIDLIDIEVVLTLDADGKEIAISKTQKQNWVTDRTTREQKFKGNVNEYEINGIPKKEADFKDYMSNYIDLENMIFCTNPMTFLRMNTKDRRATLFDLISDIDEEVITSDPKFEPLRNDLMDGTIEQLVTRSRKIKSAYEDDLKTIPARIDEVNLHITEISDEEIKEYKVSLAEEEAKLSDLDSSKEKDALSEELMKANKELFDLKLEKQKAEAGKGLKKQELEQKIATANGNIRIAESRVSEAEKTLKGYRETLQELEKNQSELSEQTFDESSLKCPVCGKKYAKAKVDSLKSQWDAEQIKKADFLKQSIADCRQNITVTEDSIKVVTESIENYKKAISGMNILLEKETEETAVFDDTKIVELENKVKELQKSLDEMNVRSGADRQAILTKISNIKAQLSKVQTNEAYRERINELTREELEISQKIANQEKMLDLLKEYQRTKISLVTDRINAYFSVIKWQFFEQQINGDFREVCIPTVNGTSYDGLLNHGDKLLAEIDLCTAFQKKLEVSCPIIIDDTESLDSWRVPTIDSQLICIRRTDDKVLEIKPLA